VNDRLKSIRDLVKGDNHSVKFGHDALGNLAWAEYGAGQFEYRMPDAVGNLFKTQSRTDRKYGPAGQLLEADGTHFEYDIEGNLIRKTESNGNLWRYDWNAAGFLAHVLRPDGTFVSFTYDALGRRLSKTHLDKTTCWIWDGNVPLHEWEEPADYYPDVDAPELVGKVFNNLTTWVFEPESFVPIAKLTDFGRYSIVTDHLGTPATMFDDAGKEIWSVDLNTYGGVRRSLGDTNDCPFRYQGQYEDVETGLYYNRFRYYDPQVGQYISQDPIGLQGGLQMYNYVCDTNNWIDVLGLTGNCRDTKPRIEDGNAKEGWQHIDERHVTGNSAKGAGDLFASGTTRPQLQRAAEVVVRDGRRVTTDPNARIQTFEKPIRVNGQRDTVRVTVDSKDNNRVITMFPARGGS
jgi:RHS repeat-associated protein